jgi:hypothetical protein
MISTQAPTLQSSFDMNNFMAVSGSADAMYVAPLQTNVVPLLTATGFVLVTLRI